MKQLLALFLTLTVLAGQAQQKNVFLDQAFWKTNPDVAAVKAEIEKGSNPAELNPNAMDGVVMAIQAKAPAESIKYLLTQKGNEVTKLTHDGRTYIFWALSAGDPAVIEYLLDKGSKLDFVDSHGATPLTFAASQKNTAIWDLLIKHGANLKKVTNAEGANLILLAVAGDKDLVMTDYFASKGVDLKATDTAGNTAFNYAARGGNIEQLKALVKRGVKYNSNAIFMVGQGGGRGPAAAAASTTNPLEIFQYFDELGIKPTVVNKNGENLLHSAVRRPNQMAMVNFLISKGVNINQADNEGNTPFMYAAASNRDTAMIDALIPMVKNINQANSKGLTALAMAMRTNIAPVIERLLAKGADLKMKDSNGDNLAFYLMQSYSPRNAAEFDAKAKLLQEKGFDIRTPQGNGNTLYHLAITRNDLDLIKRIESYKVDVNAKNKEGLTVLHKAAMTAKNDEILKYLISIGARKDIQTDLKETVFDLASENEYLAKNKTTIDFLK